MKVATFLFKDNTIIKESNVENISNDKVQLVIGFGENKIVTDVKTVAFLKEKFPNATSTLCSTAGEIYGLEVTENTLSLTAIEFATTTIKKASVNVSNIKNSLSAGEKLFELLPKENLKLIFILSDGSKVNGSELVKGLNKNNVDNILITGGLAGDGTRFLESCVGLDAIAQSGNIVAIGFYGDKLKVSHGSMGGWETFGLEREVTHSKNNVLFEIDHKNALELYKKYLGKYADELPGSALLFPLSLKQANSSDSVVRTILTIDEENQSMTFAGDLPIGSKVKFMKANFDRLIDAASEAATNSLSINNIQPKLAILISCVGRKIILSNRIDEEIEAVAKTFGTNTSITGFYSYGEISPLNPLTNCELHNQTMTITCFEETE
jgi:hypothetical protein